MMRMIDFARVVALLGCLLTSAPIIAQPASPPTRPQVPPPPAPRPMVRPPAPYYVPPPAPPRDPNDRSRPPRPRGNEAMWVTTDDYPASAQRVGAEGVSHLRLTIGVDGRVQLCEVIIGSGTTALDEAACRNLVRRARYEPALDRLGDPTIAVVSKRVNWQLPEYASILPLDLFARNDGGVIVRWHVNATGQVDQCIALNLDLRPLSDGTHYDLCPGRDEMVPLEGWYEMVVRHNFTATRPNWADSLPLPSVLPPIVTPSPPVPDMLPRVQLPPVRPAPRPPIAPSPGARPTPAPSAPPPAPAPLPEGVT